MLERALPSTGRSVIHSVTNNAIAERMQTRQYPAAAPRFPRLGLSQVWVRFLVAIAGLMLAFATALFSTVAGEAGSVWGTVILASVALLLATLVGLTTVPYLARRVVATPVRQAMDYDVTRPRMIYILINVVIRIADLQISFPARGRYCEKNFGLATRFPFSFLMKTRRINLAREVIVYPVVDSTEQFLQVLPMVTGEFETFMSGRGHDLYRIREYMPDDSARHVDWKATARTGALKVREFSREDERKLRIVFDNPAPGILEPDVYERAVRLAASLGWHFHHEDVEVSFVAPGFEPTEDVFSFLRYLALVEPQEATPVFSRLRASDDYNVIVTARSAGQVPAALAARSYVISLGVGRSD